MEKFKDLTKYLSLNDFINAKKIVDEIVFSTNKTNFEENIEKIKEAFNAGRQNRVIDFEPKNAKEKLISLYTDSDKKVSNVDKEAVLIVYIARCLYQKLELENHYLNTEDEIKDMRGSLDNFVNSYALGSWFYKDDTDWKEKRLWKN